MKLQLTKKTSLGIVIGLISILLLVLVGNGIYYFSSTLSASQCVNFCVEHSNANATSFASYSDPRYTHTYSYFVSSDGNDKQEIFVFRQEYFGPFHLNRYKLLSCSSDEGTNTTSEQVGSLLFTTVNDEGQKENGKTLVCYGKTKDEGPIKYTYTLTNDDGSASFTGSCSVQDGCWMIRFFDITSDYGHKKVISNIKIYDSADHLIGTVE